MQPAFLAGWKFECGGNTVSEARSLMLVVCFDARLNMTAVFDGLSQVASAGKVEENTAPDIAGYVEVERDGGNPIWAV